MPIAISHPSLQPKFAKIKLLICDVDGVLTDGKLYYNDQGQTMRAFHVHDGAGIKQLQLAGVTVAIITAKQSQQVAIRMQELNIQHLYQNVTDKLQQMHTLLTQLNITKESVCYIGDDIADIKAMQNVAIAIAPNNAHNSVINMATAITTYQGGMGAVREVCDTILQAQAIITGQTCHSFTG